MKTRLLIGLVLLVAACGDNGSTDHQLGKAGTQYQPRTGIVNVAPQEIWVTEGTAEEVTISLTEVPSDGPVTLTFTSQNPDQLTVPTSMTIADKTPVKLAVTATDDDLVDESPRVRIEIAVSGNGNYALTPNLSFFATAVDDEQPTGTITPAALTLATGGSADVSAVLGAPPAEEVRLSLTPNWPNVTVTPKTLVFTPDNFDVPQTTTVSVIDLNLDVPIGLPEDEPVTIVASARGSGYGRIDINNITVTITDEAPTTPTFAITPDALSLTKDPPANGDVALTLNVDPVDPVTVTAVFDAALVEVTPPSLTFDTANYAAGGAFNIAAINSGTAGDEATAVTFTVDTTGVYSGATIDPVNVTLTDE